MDAYFRVVPIRPPPGEAGSLMLNSMSKISNAAGNSAAPDGIFTAVIPCISVNSAMMPYRPIPLPIASR
jgi:hypothetical protein